MFFETDSNFDVCQEDPALQDFLNLDRDIVVCGELMDTNILAEVKKKMEIGSSDDEEEQTEFPTSSEALNHLYCELNWYVKNKTNG